MTTLADAVEIYLKFLRVSLDAGPSTSNPRTEIALLEVMRQALKEERSMESFVNHSNPESVENESRSGGNPSEKSACLPADDRGFAEARSSEGGIGGQKYSSESIQSCEPVGSDPASVGAESVRARRNTRCSICGGDGYHKTNCDRNMWTVKP